MNASLRTARVVRRQRGFTLIEIMIALLVALFLLAGLGTMVAGTRRTGTNQMSLAQLQDEQRLAMSMLNDVIQNAGYFDTNTYYTAASAFPAAFTTTGGSNPITLAAGQVVGGIHTSISAPDSIAVRYSTNGTDGIINCVGGSGAAATYVNYFFIKAGTNPTTNPSQLQCSSDGKTSDAVSLVSNVVNMQMWYGVSTAGGTASSVDTYMTADQVTASTGGWPTVTSVRVTLTFDNPLWKQPGQQLQYVYLTRVIALQTRSGAVFP
jgi:type IV pilus assembly protein PilW